MRVILLTFILLIPAQGAGAASAKWLQKECVESQAFCFGYITGVWNSFWNKPNKVGTCKLGRDTRAALEDRVVERIKSAINFRNASAFEFAETMFRTEAPCLLETGPPKFKDGERFVTFTNADMADTISQFCKSSVGFCAGFIDSIIGLVNKGASEKLICIKSGILYEELVSRYLNYYTTHGDGGFGPAINFFQKALLSNYPCKQD